MTNKPIVAKMADGALLLLYADPGVEIPSLETLKEQHSENAVHLIEVAGENTFSELRLAIQRALGGEGFKSLAAF